MIANGTHAVCETKHSSSRRYSKREQLISPALSIHPIRLVRLIAAEEIDPVESECDGALNHQAEVHAADTDLVPLRGTARLVVVQRAAVDEPVPRGHGFALHVDRAEPRTSGRREAGREVPVERDES